MKSHVWQSVEWGQILEGTDSKIENTWISAWRQRDTPVSCKWAAMGMKMVRQRVDLGSVYGGPEAEGQVRRLGNRGTCYK